MKRRYPGPRPFSYDDHSLFYGREQEIEYISTLILNQRTTVLHGKSGYGKTSLLNAGIIPNLMENFNCQIIRVRLYNFDKDKILNPTNTFRNTIKIQQTSARLYLQELVPTSPESAWRYFKKLQAESIEKINIEKQEALVSGSNYILIFDQFEELFTYPKPYVTEFAKEICDLLQNRIPIEYQAALKELFSKNSYPTNLPTKELSILKNDVPVKLIFAIRSDRFNHLTYLTDFIPGLLTNTYKLKRMTEHQVKLAIVMPALSTTDFDSPNFEFDPPLLTHIIEFLSSNNEEEKKIEVFEMQIICSSLENILINHAVKEYGVPPILLTEALIIESQQIKDSKQLFREIIKNYYIQSITSIGDKLEQLSARYLIEQKLIDSYTTGRVSLDHAFIQRLGIGTETITYLIDKRLIRIELNSFSGRSYELSHGSLVKPILLAANEFGNLNTQLDNFFQDTLRSYGKKEREEMLDALFSLLPVERESELFFVDLIETKNLEILKKSPLVTKIKLLVTDDKKVNKLLIKETFARPLQDLKTRSQQHNIKNLLKKYSWVITGSVLLIIALMVAVVHINKIANRNFGLVYVAYQIDSIKSKVAALQLVKYIYDKPFNTEKEKIKIRSKSLELMKTPEVHSAMSIFTDTVQTANLKNEDLDIAEAGDYLLVQEYNDSDSSYKKGKFRITEINTRSSKKFDSIGYAYFINQAHTVALAKTSTSFNWFDQAITRTEDTLTLLNAKTGDTISSSRLGKGRYLYPIGYGVNNQNADFDSYRARLTSAGNLIIPFFEKDSSNNISKKVGLWLHKADSIISMSNMSISTSKDDKRFMSGLSTIGQIPFMTIYNENGQLLDTIQNTLLADFTPRGSVVFTRKDNSLAIRSYDNSGARSGDQKIIKTNRLIDYVFVNREETAVLLQNANLLQAISTKNLTRIWESPDQLVSINFNNDVVITFTKQYDSSSKVHADRLYRRSLTNNKPSSYPCPGGIKSVKYNSNKDQVLLLTNENKLLLIDRNMKNIASFQLTPNDLFGFSKDGNRIYYVRDKLISIFENDKQLIDVFDFDKGYQWLHHNKKIEPLSWERIKEYEKH